MCYVVLYYVVHVCVCCVACVVYFVFRFVVLVV